MDTDGKRVTQLRKALGRALDAAFRRKVAEEAPRVFSGELKKKHALMISDYTQQTLDSVKANVLDEFGVICRDHGLVEKLNQLDAEELSRPLMPDGGRLDVPAVHTAQSVLAAKEAELAKLRELLSQVRGENEAKLAEVEQLRGAVAAQKTQMEEGQSSVQSTLAVCEQWSTN